MGSTGDRNTLTFLRRWSVGVASLGVGMGTGLYGTAFAIVVERRGAEARRGITAVSLIGALGGGLGWPITRAISEASDWRSACLAWVLAHLLVCLPATLLALSPREREPEDIPTRAPNTLGSTYDAARGPICGGLVRVDSDGRAPSSRPHRSRNERGGCGMGGRSDGGMCGRGAVVRSDLAPQVSSAGDGSARLPLPSCRRVGGPARRGEVRAAAGGRPRPRERTFIRGIRRAFAEDIWSRTIRRATGHAPDARALSSGRSASRLRHRLGSLDSSSSHPLGWPLPGDVGVKYWP